MSQLESLLKRARGGLGPLAYFDTQSQTLVVIIATWFFGFFLIGGIVLISRRK